MSDRSSLIRFARGAFLASIVAARAFATPVEDAEVGRRVSLVVQVPAPAPAETEVVAHLQDAGGFVRARALESSGVIGLDLEVDAGAWDGFVAKVRGLGRVLQETVEVRDPVEAIARTNGRISALKIAEQGLMEQLSYLAPDDALALDVARELDAVRKDLAEQIARRAAIEHRLAYAAVHIRLEPPGNGSLWSDTLDAWRLFGDSPPVALRRAAPWLLGLGLPAAAFVFALASLVVWIRGRRNSRTRSDETEAPRC